jgi:16S rRNA (guanine1207-N2)-methyltransferase
MANIPIEPGILQAKVRPPVAVILGSPAEVARLVATLETEEITCYQMDLHQAERLREELQPVRPEVQVVAAPDLWDLPADFQTAIYPAPEGGERSLKLDLVEQAFHILHPQGTLLVLSPFEADNLFPAVLKKVFRRVHAPATDVGQVFWCRREGNRPPRRHEMMFQARMDDSTSLRFVSRPGVFSYGRFDHGARALVETMRVAPGDRVVDIGCGCGTNGIWAGRLSGPEGHVAFVDSNLRALALAELNARANGLPSFEVIASSRVEDLPPDSFDVALANPPYYAQGSIARLFLLRGRTLLRPGGRLYLVTKQADQVGPLMAELFGRTDVVSRRGYQVLCTQVPDAR